MPKLFDVEYANGLASMWDGKRWVPFSASLTERQRKIDANTARSKAILAALGQQARPSEGN